MMQLQRLNGVVQSVIETRQIRSDLNDVDFAAWYEERYKITVKRVQGILAAARGMTA